jgi:hypothetical protein
MDDMARRTLLPATIITLLLVANGCAPTIAHYEPQRLCDGSGAPCGSHGGAPHAVTSSSGPTASAAPPGYTGENSVLPRLKEEVAELTGQAQEQARLEISLEKGYPPREHQSVFEVARTIGYTMATAERCGVPVRPLERLIRDYESTVRTEVAVKLGLAVNEGRAMRETSTLRFTTDNCVGIDRVLRFYKDMMRGAIPGKPTELSTGGAGWIVATAEACGVPQATIQPAMPHILLGVMPSRRWEDVLAESRRVRTGTPPSIEQCTEIQKVIGEFAAR